MDNLYLNARYDGYAKIPLFLDRNHLTFVKHYYEETQKPTTITL